MISPLTSLIPFVPDRLFTVRFKVVLVAEVVAPFVILRVPPVPERLRFDRAAPVNVELP